MKFEFGEFFSAVAQTLNQLLVFLYLLKSRYNRKSDPLQYRNLCRVHTEKLSLFVPLTPYLYSFAFPPSFSIETDTKTSLHSGDLVINKTRTEFFYFDIIILETGVPLGNFIILIALSFLNIQ